LGTDTSDINHPPEKVSRTLLTCSKQPSYSDSLFIDFYWEHFPVDTQLIRLHTICRLTSPSLTTQV